MLLHPSILADDNPDWIKLIPVIVVGGIWVLGILSSIAKKAGRGKATTRITPPAPIPPRRLEAPPPMRSIAPRNTMAPPPMRPLRQPPPKSPARIARPGALAKSRTDAMFASRQADAIRQMLTGGRAPAPPQRREPVPPKRRQPASGRVAQPSSDIPLVSPTKAASLVDGRSLARRMQPGLLRYQFILTEVMRPPLALREEDDTGW
jgi:hypothetical protein